MSERRIVSDEEYNPFQSPSVESYQPDAPHLREPVAMTRVAVGTVLACVVLVYGTLLAEFIPQLPRPQVPMAGLLIFSLCVAVIAGFAGRGRLASSAWSLAAVIFVFGWLLYLAVIHLASRTGIHAREFKFIWPYIAAFAAMTLLSTRMRNWRRTSDRQSSTGVPVESGPDQ